MIKAPRIYIKNSQDQMIAVLDGDYYEDTLERYLSGKASIFSCKFYKKEYDYQKIVAGCKLAFDYNGEDFWMNIMNVYQDEDTMEIEAWSLSLELNNEMKSAYSAPKAMTFVEYATLFDFENAFEIGINEIADKTIQYEWTGESTLLARILSLTSVFDAEIEFVTQNDQFHHLDKIILNIYKKHDDFHQGLGKDRRSEIFRYGKELTTVNKTEDVSELYTGIKAYGKDGLTLSGYSKEEKNEDGVVEYYTFNEMVRAPLARDRFPSNVKLDNDRYITYYWDSDDTTQEALYNNALAKLKELSVPKVTWEIEGFVDVSIGDSITLADDGYKPALYLEARVSEQTISFTDQSRNKTTFTNAVEVASEISADLLGKMQAMIEANKKYEYQILSDNGTVFKNETGSTTLTARVLDNAKDITENFSIKWTKSGATFATAKAITIHSADFEEKAVYRFEATDNSGNIKGGYEVTVTNVDDGEKGTDGEAGKDGEPGKDGKPGKGVESSENSYTLSDQGNTPPASGWSVTQPIPQTGKYLWTRTRFKYTDETYSTYLYSLSQFGKDGIMVSESAPETPDPNQLWQNPTDPTGNVLRWDGTSWVNWGMSINNILAENLQVENGVFKKVTGAIIEGSEFINTYDQTFLLGTKSVGKLKIAGSEIKNVGIVVKDEVVTGNYQQSIAPNIIMQSMYEGTTQDADKLVGSSSVSYDLISLNDYKNGYAGSLTARQLTEVPWTNITILSGYSVNEGNTPQFRKIQLIDGTYEIQIRGSLKKNNGNFKGGEIVASIPAGNWPMQNSESFMQPGNGAAPLRCQIYGENGDIAIATQVSNTMAVWFSGIRYQTTAD